jgi:hypothetical protein
MTASEPASPPIEPRLFDLVTQYASAVTSGKTSTKGPLKKTTPIVEFCRTFFQQFFEHVLGREITGIDADAKLAAINLRLDLEEKHGSESVRRLISSFEDLCEMWPDVLGFSYGGSASEFKRFNTAYVPELLGEIRDWAQEAGYPELVDRAGTALAAFESAATRF